MRVALYRTEEVITSRSSSASSTVKTSDTSDISEGLSWTSLIRENKEFDLPTTSDLVGLKFSSDSRILMAVTNPYKREHSHIHQYSVFVWDVATGRRLSILTTKNEVRWNGFTTMQLSARTKKNY